MGKYGTRASLNEYDRLVAEWLQSGRRLVARSTQAEVLTVSELIATYWMQVTAYYIKDGSPTSEQVETRIEY